MSKRYLALSMELIEFSEAGTINKIIFTRDLKVNIVILNIRMNCKNST